MLWLFGELGEVADVIKQNGAEAIMDNEKVRADFVEEMADALMYFNTVMLCCNVTAAELAASFRAKYVKNLTRRWKTK